MTYESKLCTASIMWTYTVAFYRKSLIDPIVDISTKKKLQLNIFIVVVYTVKICQTKNEFLQACSLVIN